MCFSSSILKIGKLVHLDTAVHTLSYQCVTITETFSDSLTGWSELTYFEQKLSVHRAGMGKSLVSSARVVSRGGDIVGSKERMLQDFTTAKKILS